MSGRPIYDNWLAQSVNGSNKENSNLDLTNNNFKQ